MSTPLTAPLASDLIVQVRMMLNQPDPNNSTWTNAEITTWLNDAVNRYFPEIVEYAEGQFTTQVDLNITANAETIDLPSDFYKAKCLYKAINNGFRVIPYQNALIQSYDTDVALGTDSNAFSYYFRNNSIVLRPTPNFSQTAGLRLEYIHYPTQLIAGQDTLDNGISPVFKELIINYALVKAKIRESLVTGTDTAAYAGKLLDQAETTFRESVRTRSKYPQYTVPFNP